ncbi:MAG: putative radical superfamily protein [Bacillales bacterium]|jgi:radical SAM enzyme (TIGR01210 family)|nr:putative radical superfamily protein [Bacillales bacterium]
MQRYSKITQKNQREIVLLKGRPCFWGKCTFCDYIEDNTRDNELMISKNEEILSQVTGEFGVLEVINSGSVFELPKETWAKIKQVVDEKQIRKLFFESHWGFRNRLQEVRDYFGVEVWFKIGVETFDNNFRQNVLIKGADFETPEEVAELFDSACVMVGIAGQTIEIIREDMAIIQRLFKHATVNVFVENTTPVKADIELIRWFEQEFSFLEENPKIEVLWHNTDLGVG